MTPSVGSFPQRFFVGIGLCSNWGCIGQLSRYWGRCERQMNTVALHSKIRPLLGILFPAGFLVHRRIPAVRNPPVARDRALPSDPICMAVVSRAKPNSQREHGADSNRSPPKRNRSLDPTARKIRILKIHRAETRPGILGLRCEMSDISRRRPGSWPLSFGNVGTSRSAGNPWE